MNPQQLVDLRKRIGNMVDRDLFQSLLLFEHVEAIDVHMRDMMATVLPDQSLPENEVDIVGLLRAELRKRILKKSRGTGG